jgi:hypothetical protein
MEGQSVTFAVVASGTDPLSYQWQKNGVDIPGATSSSLTTGPVALSDNGAKYRVIVTNSCGSATSVEAILAVKAKVLHIPQNQGHTTIGNQKAIAIGSNKAANNIEITSTERE